MEQSPINLAHEPPFFIQGVEIRPSTREMWVGGHSAILEPRVMQVLVALWQAKGEVVSKSDLIARCWDQRVVGDDAINRVISRLRHNAEHDADGAFKIETVTKVGYRLIVVGADDQRRPSSFTTYRLDRRAAMVGASVVSVGALAGWALTKPSQSSAQVDALVSDGWQSMIQGTPEQRAASVGLLRRAIDLDPDNSRALGLLAVAYAFQASSLPGEASSAARQQAIATAQRALALDPDNSDAAAARVWLDVQTKDRLQQWRDCQTLVARHPNAVFANLITGKFASNVGFNTIAARCYASALKVEPNAVGAATARALILDDMGQTAAAQQEIDRLYRIWPKHYAVWFTRITILAYGGRPAEALAMMDDPARWPVGIPEDNRETVMAQVAALADRSPARIADAVDKSMALAATGVGFAENTITFLGTLGMVDRFFELADRYFFDLAYLKNGVRYSREQQDYAPNRQRLTYFLFRRTLSQMWNDPRFASLTRRIGLDAFWAGAKIEPDFRSA